MALAAITRLRRPSEEIDPRDIDDDGALPPADHAQRHVDLLRASDIDSPAQHNLRQPSVEAQNLHRHHISPTQVARNVPHWARARQHESLRLLLWPESSYYRVARKCLEDGHGDSPMAEEQFLLPKGSDLLELACCPARVIGRPSWTTVRRRHYRRVR